MKINKFLLFIGTFLLGNLEIIRAERYSFVLIPTKENDRKTYINFAHTFFKSYADAYLLGNGSIPHITLCQFIATPIEIRQLKNCADKPIINEYIASFRGISFIQGAGDFEGINWIELSVIPDKKLLEIQKQCLDFLESRDIVPVNALGVHYRPHLTLANTRSTKIFDFTFSAHLLKQAPFSLCLIKNDENWQCIELIG